MEIINMKPIIECPKPKSENLGKSEDFRYTIYLSWFFFRHWKFTSKQDLKLLVLL